MACPYVCMIHQVSPDHHEKKESGNKNRQNTSQVSILTLHRVKKETIRIYRSTHDTGRNFTANAPCATNPVNLAAEKQCVRSAMDRVSLSLHKLQHFN